VIMLNFEGWKPEGYQADVRSFVLFIKMVLVGHVMKLVNLSVYCPDHVLKQCVFSKKKAPSLTLKKMEKERITEQLQASQGHARANKSIRVLVGVFGRKGSTE
ncbi:hypothetical protein Tco_0644667, partial [Tanacetum coccineum]